ncbi:glycosyltransferase involved in cell wall biosynthesis [Paraburkholderia unamae]|nr:glycosyltransferase involved in cell wall biosynthesis [Paraburkholderia unamae]
MNSMAARKLLSVVAPVYNEADAIPIFLRALDATFGTLPDIDWEVVFVNDGSADATLAVLEREAGIRGNIVIVDLSRNFGKEAALTAGLDFANGDAVVPMDVDLQDPPELISQMLALWREGWEVVVARRQDRSADSAAKRVTARAFYRLMSRISRPALPQDVGDFRLMDRKVVDAIRRLPEKRRFMKGLFAWVGFRTTEVSYERPARAAGQTKFNSWKLWNLALEGITSFSTLPLRVWTYFGAAIASVAFLYGAIIIARTFVRGIDVPGYASLVVLILFFGGIQLVTLGVIGEYLGRTYEEAKQRPVYVVRNCIRSAAGAASAVAGIAANAAASLTGQRESIEQIDRVLHDEAALTRAVTLTPHTATPE